VTVRAVGLVGGGTMGQGIAVTCAAAGLDVLERGGVPTFRAADRALRLFNRWAAAVAPGSATA